MRLSNKKGFTLIELLLVIAIIAILAGVVIAIIRPDIQQARARQSTARAKVAKACLAYHACMAATNSVTSCNTDAKIGLQNFTGAGEGGNYSVVALTGFPQWMISAGVCTISCTQTSTAVSVGGADCLIVQ